ncbi:MAG TPA: PepSY-like domain-containing protein [Puia sp.]|uniref:PepSY-like domain-containing protein n=1 Tax=Puia sp. TaxID=2045100 RepID=UPI002D18AFB3|nr:PepSY-like domain-containing protein [Puia sp.]HVU99067.1 PepSY-like domain-containing protein [Puia sp.]
MKKILLPLLGIALAFSFTGKKLLPATIAAGVNAKYPGAKIKGWEIVNDRYKIKITADRSKEVTWFSTDGKWLRTEKHLGLTKDLPAAVKHGFRHSGYADWKIDDISEVSSPDEPLRYRLDIDNGTQLDSWHYDAFKKEVLLYFDRNGVIIKKTGA